MHSQKKLQDDINAVTGVICNFAKLEGQLPELSRQYQSGQPFPHIALDNFLETDVAKAAMIDYDAVDWQTYKHYNENKSGNKNKTFPPNIDNVMQALNSDEFLGFLSELTGIQNLIADHDFGSGGVHRSTRGGFLNIHADFTVHPYRTDWHRRINVLVYLNEKWEDSWGGFIELWNNDMSKCVQKYAPIFNRCVIFNTDYDSYHGHPEPTMCPEGVYRNSIALYYYTKASEDVRSVPTNYRPRPNDSMIKSALIWLDKQAVKIFHNMKTIFGISDTAATKFFESFSNKNSKNNK